MKVRPKQEFRIELVDIKKRFKVRVRQPEVWARDCTVVVDRDFVIQMASPSTRKNLGILHQELIGQSIFTYLNSKYRRIIIRSLQDAWRNDVYLFELQGVRLHIDGDTSRIFDIMIHLVEDEEDSFSFIINLQPADPEAGNREELKRVTEQLDRILYSLSHDFRSPLLTALGLINLAQIDPDYDRFMYMEMIKDNILKLDYLTSRLTRLAKNQKSELKREWIDWHIVIEESLARNQEDRVEVHVEYDIKAAFYTDLFRLSIIVNNLISNAYHFQDFSKEDNWVQITVEVNKEACTFEVKDNGIGIDADQQSRIFDLFYRGSLSSKGSGLGLYMVKNSVQILKGDINVKSTPNEGACFTVTLPNLIKD